MTDLITEFLGTGFASAPLVVQVGGVMMLFAFICIILNFIFGCFKF